jgi:hypothetical protein
MPTLSTLQRIAQQRLGPDGMRHAFYGVQLGLGVLIFAVFWMFRSKRTESAFALREAERLKREQASQNGSNSGNPALADARLKKKPPEKPLALPGIRIDGPAHEILGVASDASAEIIQRAYRERMKQYHPDKVAPPGTQQWQDAQKIAEAINRAKTELLKRAR